MTTDTEKKRVRSALPDARRADYFMVPVGQLVLVKDTDHFLYKPDLDAPLDPAFVQRIRKRGVRNPLRVAKDGERILIVAGRSRYRAVVEVINPEREREGAELITHLPCIVVKGNEVDQIEEMADENLHRKSEATWSVAVSAGRWIQQQGDDATRYARAAEVFKASEKQVRRYETFCGLARRLQEAVKLGATTLSAAVVHWKKSKSEQTAIACGLIEAHNSGKKRSRASRKPGRRKLEDAAAAVRSGKARVALLWATGKASWKDMTREFPELARAEKGGAA